MSRQNYYAARRLRRREVDEELIVGLARRERQMQPRLGARKLMHLLEGDLKEAQVSIGRDRFFEVMARHDLLVVPKVGRARTTKSRHSLPVFSNLLRGRTITGSNQAWVSDLTYIRTEEGFLYAAVITDVHSRKIVGAHIGDSLEAEVSAGAGSSVGESSGGEASDSSLRSGMSVLLPRVGEAIAGSGVADQHDPDHALLRERLGRARPRDPEAGV